MRLPWGWLELFLNQHIHGKQDNEGGASTIFEY